MQRKMLTLLVCRGPLCITPVQVCSGVFSRMPSLGILVILGLYPGTKPAYIGHTSVYTRVCTRVDIYYGIPGYQGIKPAYIGQTQVCTRVPSLLIIVLVLGYVPG